MGQVIASRLMSTPPPGVDPSNAQDAAWWCKLLGRIIGVFAGLVVLVTGVISIVSLSPLCIFSGILMVMVGIVVLVFEAPMCCTFVEFLKPVAAFAEHRTFLQKAIVYIIMGIIPFVLCFGLTTLFGCGLVFATGVIYGLMGLGRKADREQMMAAAATTGNNNQIPPQMQRSDDTKVGLIDNQEAYQYPPPQGGFH